MWQVRVHQPFFFLCLFFTLVPLQRKRLRMLHLFSSSVVLMRLGQKMTTNATFVVVFYSSYETRVQTMMNVPRPCLLLFFLHCRRQWRTSQLIIVFYNSRKKQKKHRKSKEDEEPFSSSFSFTTQEKKTLILVFLRVQYEPPGLLSFFFFFFWVVHKGTIVMPKI
jgi:hypothetical protein